MKIIKILTIYSLVIIVFSCVLFLFKGNQISEIFVTSEYWISAFLPSFLGITIGSIIGRICAQIINARKNKSK